MTRMTTKLLTALFVIGCGSGAMANPDRGQWTGYGASYDQTAPIQAAQPSSTMEEEQDSSEQSAPPAAQSGCPEQEFPQAGPPEQEPEEELAEPRPWAGAQPRLGVMVMSMTPDLRRHLGAPNDSGVLIAKVEPSSAAARAGILVGDVLLRVGRQPVRTSTDVIQALATHGGGRTPIVVIRQGRYLRFDAILPGPRQQPQPAQPPQPPESPAGHSI